jgi:hypothetical protein
MLLGMMIYENRRIQRHQPELLSTTSQDGGDQGRTLANLVKLRILAGRILVPQLQNQTLEIFN